MENKIYNIVICKIVKKKGMSGHVYWNDLIWKF